MELYVYVLRLWIRLGFGLGPGADAQGRQMPEIRGRQSAVNSLSVGDRGTTRFSDGGSGLARTSCARRLQPNNDTAP